MNVAMRMTMSGLTRALRGFAHDLANELEQEGEALLRAARKSDAAVAASDPLAPEPRRLDSEMSA